MILKPRNLFLLSLFSPLLTMAQPTAPHPDARGRAHKMKAKFIILFFLPGIHLLAQQAATINYLNEKPPGMVAELFAPGTVSSPLSEHSSPAFSPDGTVVLWTVMNKNYRGSLWEMRYQNGLWSTPRRPSFADSTADDYYASFSPDGKKLYFSSRRKAPAPFSQNIDMRIWAVERTETGWGNPVPLDTVASQGREYAHSITKNGTLYFSSPHGGGTSLNIHKAEKKNGHYIKPVLLPYNINTVNYEDGAFVAADESFLIFESDRPEGIAGSIDLYISFKSTNGRWCLPVNMGTKINSAGSERFARLSPDGKYLFFGSTRNSSAERWGFDIYWIDAKVIDELRNSEAAKKTIGQPLGHELMKALYNNDDKTAARSLKQWLQLYPNSLDATVVYSSTLRKQKRYAAAQQLLTNKTARLNEKNTSIIMEKALVNFGMDKNDDAVKLLAPFLVPADALRQRLLYLSNSLLAMKKFIVSEEYFQKAMALGANGYEYIRRAALYVLANEKNRAFEALQKAVGFDYIKKNDFENNTGLASLKSDARWKLLVEKLK